MLEWPKRLQELYPLPPTPRQMWGSREYNRQVPTRPWWSWPEIVRSPEGTILTDKIVGLRRDGVILTQRGRKEMFAQVGAKTFMYKVERKGSWQELRLKVATEMDAQFPLPHPGFRVGQVWANEEGWATTIISTFPDAPGCRIVCGTGPIGEEIGERYPYLVADMVCPWLAPWSPREKGGEL